MEFAFILLSGILLSFLLGYVVGYNKGFKHEDEVE